MSYEILEDKINVKFRAEGSSREEAYSNVINAFADITDSDREAGTIRHSIQVSSENMETLLFDLLKELIELQKFEEVAVCQPKQLHLEDNIEEHDEFKIEATVWTQTITPGTEIREIKAPTHDEMKTNYVDGEWILEAKLET